MALHQYHDICFVHGRSTRLCKPYGRAKDGYHCMFELIKHWMDNCLSKTGNTGTIHEQCANSLFPESHSSTVPTRLIHIGSEDSPDSPHLVKFESRTHLERNQAPAKYRGYATLSYCWGPNPSTEFLLREENEQQFMKALPRLPKTIQDALDICRRIGIRYLWVDALCIIQKPGSESEDWKVESARVGNYYSNATFTIAALWSSHNNGGCLPIVPQRRSFFRKVTENIYNETYKLFHDKYDVAFRFHSEFIYKMLGSTTSFLLDRGWVMQELTLSARSESGKFRIFGIPYVIPAIRDPDHTWCKIVMQYTKTTFSYPDDRLPALSGICKALDPDGEDQYLAGIWKSHLLHQFTWVVWEFREPVDEHALKGLPSWSWISVYGKIHFRDWAGMSREGQCKEESCTAKNLRLDAADIKLQYADLYGKISSASLEVEVSMLRLEYPGFEEAFWESNRRRTILNIGSGITCSIWFDSEKLVEKAEEDQTVTADTILLYHNCQEGIAFLILVEQAGGENSYRRIGLAGYNHPDDAQQEETKVLKTYFGEETRKMITFV